MPSGCTDEVTGLIKTMARLGMAVTLPSGTGALGVLLAARRLDVSTDWIKAHLDEFPNWYRLPAGSGPLGNVGEIRIPVRDLDAFELRRKKLRGAA